MTDRRSKLRDTSKGDFASKRSVYFERYQQYLFNVWENVIILIQRVLHTQTHDRAWMRVSTFNEDQLYHGIFIVPVKLNKSRID